MHGYEIRSALAHRTNRAFNLRDAVLYGPLYRMSSRELIRSWKELVGEKRFRVYYHLKEKGESHHEP